MHSTFDDHDYQAHPYNLSTNSFLRKGGTQADPMSNCRRLKNHLDPQMPWLSSLDRTMRWELRPKGASLSERVLLASRDTLADHHLIHELVQRGPEHPSDDATSKFEVPSSEAPSDSLRDVGYLPGNLSKESAAIPPDEKHPSSRKTQLQSFKSAERMGSIGGAGDLPGKRSEHGIALTPERLHPAANVSSPAGKNHELAAALTTEEGRMQLAAPFPALFLPDHTDHGLSASHRRCHPLLFRLPHFIDPMPAMQHLPGSVIGLGSLPCHRTEKGASTLPDDMEERLLEQRSLKAQVARKLAELDQHAQSERVELETNGGAMANCMARGLNDVVEECEGKPKELHQGGKETLFGILYLDEQRRQAAQATLDKAQLAELQLRTRTIPKLRNEWGQKRIYKSWPTTSHRAWALPPSRLLPLDPGPNHHLQRQPDMDRGATGLLNRAYEGISELTMTSMSRSIARRRIAERAGNAFSHAEVLSGVTASVSSRAPGLLSGAGHKVASVMHPEAIDRTRSPIANHQDKMEFVDSSLESNAQEIALSPRFWSPRVPTTSTITPSANVIEQGRGDSQLREHTPGIPVVVTNASVESLADGSLCDSPRTRSLPGVTPCLCASRRSNQGLQDGRVGRGGQYDSWWIGTERFVPSHINHGVGGVGFTTDAERRRLQLQLGCSIEFKPTSSETQAALQEDDSSLRALQLPDLLHIESNASMEAVEGSVVGCDVRAGINP
ncbi:hypothetical protein BKA70DRAFT_1407432 [Coprinopsis sp. MPI-PUGE-AT-0042]|nr:hypothetical protein BKA70DRAFT_1407432 [Coprinopsis sp. MPI-PUGE-AT-0042]